SFSVVLAAFGKLLPERLRLVAFGAGTAAGSFGQFPLFPRGGLADGCLRLADRAPRLRRGHAAGAAAVACARDGTGRDGRVGGRRIAIAPAGTFGGDGSPILCAAGARVLHLRLPTRISHRCHAGLSHRPRPVGASRRLDHRGDRAVQHRRLAVLGFIVFPVTPFSSILFGAVMGLLWLSTVPPTNGIIALIF